MAVVLLVDGEDSGDTKATYVLYVMRGTDWCKWQDLRPSGGGSSPVMVARQSSAREAPATASHGCLNRARYEL